MYKNVVLLFFLCSTLLQGQEGTYYYKGYVFESGKEVYLFGDQVKLRSKPSTDSEVLKTLRIGEPVVISKKEAITKKYKGIESPWYEVRYHGQTGYILGGLLSLEKLEIQGDTFLFSFSVQDDTNYLHIRSIQTDIPYKEVQTKLYTSWFSLKLFNDRGVDGVHSIVLIDYLSESCGEDGGGTYIFNTDDNGLVKAFDYSDIGDAGIFYYDEVYTFPNDPNGVKGKILYHSVTESRIDDDSDEMKIEKESQVFLWRNNKLVPQK
jgi:uncharacterized protein YgiM (DUF1202 family)